VIGYYAGQKQCFVGMAVCVDGNWSECLDPESRHGKEVIARAQGKPGDQDPHGTAGAAAD
jgi:hypothetical protein